MHTHVHSQGDEEEERYSAQQRGARPHDQYDKADRSALERTSAGRLRQRIDGHDSLAHIRREGLVSAVTWCAFAPVRSPPRTSQGQYPIILHTTI